MVSDSPLPYSVVIATLDRPGRLREALAALARQHHPPERIVVVDASAGEASRAISEGFAGSRLDVEHRRAARPSAALQRNTGSELVATPCIAFIDDDVVPEGDVFAKLASALADRSLVGVAARQRDLAHSPPGLAARLFYRLQAGYGHPSYGGRLFGSAVACVPTYEEPAPRGLIRGEWLPAGCLLLRTDAFREAGGFPSFDGYSPLEDVHLTATMARRGGLAFHRDAWFDHFPSSSAAKTDRFELGRARLRNRRFVGRDVMEVGPLTLEAKLLLHRLFDTAVLARTRPPGWFDEVLGTWCG